MKCPNLFYGKNKTNISICRLLKILLGVLSVIIILFQQIDTSLKVGLAHYLKAICLQCYYNVKKDHYCVYR